MDFRSKSSLARLLALLCLWILPAAASAQTYTYSIYVDSDARADTGCNEGAVAGAEVRLDVTASGGLTPQVLQVARSRCSSGAFGAAANIGGGYPVGADNGVAGSDVIELADDLSQLASPGSPSLVFSIVATSTSGQDTLLTVDGSPGGAPIALGLPAVAIPVLGVPALILMALLLMLVGSRVARRRALWRVLALVSLLSGVAVAANFIVDGQVGDWSGVAPLATDPAGDASSGESAIDLRAFFAAIENDRVYMRVDVTNLENNAPTALAGTATTLEDNAVTITLTGTDNENDPLTFAIVSNPTLGTLGPVTPTGPQTATVLYTPNADANGSDSFTFTVDDGQATSAAAPFSITITPVNDAPSFSAGADQTVLEDAGAQSIANWATAISTGPANESTQTIGFVISNDNNALFSAQPAVSPTGTLSFTPAADANGTATVTVAVQDSGGTANGGVDTSPTQTFTITVTAVNDAPSFTAGPDQNLVEGAGAQTVNPWATAISAGPPDESGQVLSFTVSNDNNTLFSVQPAVSPTGVLTYTVAAGENGSATVTVTLSDDGGTANGGVDTSAAQTFTIDVAGVNDAPSFTAGPDQTVLEDAGPQTVNPWATAISAGPPNESGQVVTFNVTGNTNPSLFSAAPAVSSTGVLTYTPAANANGTATITLVAMDDGGTANGGVDTSPPQTFTITVTSVNDAPSFVKGPDPTVLEDAGAQTVAGWATAISAGPADESGQTLTFNVTGNTNPALFAAGPAISPTGTLSFTPAADANGSATITLVLADNGGTANGGVDTSAAQTFVINVTAVNDVPSFTKGTDQTVAEDAGAQTVNPWATSISAGPANESAQTLTFNVTGNTNPGLFSAGPAISPAGVLTYTPTANASGAATITLVLTDNGGTANGGVDTSAAQTFVITVTAVNDAPLVDLNGPAAGTDFAATYTEGNPAVAIVDPAALTVSDVDNVNLASATVTITNLLDPSFEQLGANTGGTSITANYVAATGVLTLTGADTLANYQAVLRSLTYLNSSTAPTETPRTISVVANDGTDDSNIAISIVTVIGVNTIPSFTGGPPVTINEDAGAQTIPAWATAINDNDGGLQTLNFTVTPTGGSLAFSAAPAISPTGTLSFTTAANASGSATFDVVLTDSGSNNNTSAAQTLTITANPVNDAPSFSAGADQTVLEDAGAQSVPGWATAISPGPADESGQTVSFNVTGNTNPGLFSAAPAISPTGTLSYAAAADAFGSATISLTLSDNGGTANGGVDTSAVQTFVITVNPVNDAPSFLKGGDEAVFDDAGPVTVNPWATAISAGPANESGQTISFVIDSNSAPGAFATGPAVSAAGVLTYTPATVPAGPPVTATIVLHAMDNGGTTNGGVDVSPAQSFTIEITHANEAPVLTNPVITYATAGNTQLHVAGATLPGRVAIIDAVDALAKSVPTDADGPLPPSVVPASGASTNGGSYSIAANGAFTYVPAAGFSGVDTFTFQVTDGNTPTPGIAVGTASITVGPTIWYVDNLIDANNGAGGDGRSTNAFDNLAGAQASSVNGDIIFVYRGAANYTTGIVLKDGQRLWGEAFGLTVAPFGTLVPAGTQPAIVTGGTDTVSVPATAGNRTGVEIRGLSLSGNQNAIDVTATGANNVGVLISGNTIAGAAAEGIDVNFGSTGTQGIAIQSNTVTATGTGIDVTRTAGAATITAFDGNVVGGNTGGSGIVVNGAVFDATPGNPINTVNGGVTTIGATGNGVGAGGLILSNVTGDLSFTDLDIVNDSGAGLQVLGSGALNAGAGTGFRIAVAAGVGSLASVGGPALDVNNASVSLPLGNVQSSNSTTTGIALVNAFGGIGSTAFSATGGSLADPGGASGIAFSVNGGNGNIVFPGSITSTSGNAVSVTNRSSDAVTLAGAITESGSGILLTNNTGATIAFSGPLSLSTATNPAFTATGGGTVSASNATSTASTTTAIALNVINTTIGAAGLNFRSISSGTAVTGPASGIILNNTGSSGGLTVSGSGTPGSGGTIQNSTASGISLTSTTSVSLTRMNISTSGDDGITGTSVNGFSCDFCVLSANGNSGTDEGMQFNELTGNFTLSSSTFSGSAHNHLYISNSGGTLATLNLTGNTFNANGSTFGNHAVLIEGLGGAPVFSSMSITGNSFISARSIGLQILGNNSTSMPSVTVTGNVFTDNVLAADLSLIQTSNMTFNVSNNTINSTVANGSHALNSNQGIPSSGTVRGRYQNNVIGTAGSMGSGSMIGNGMRIIGNDNGTKQYLVDNTAIRETRNGRGIEVVNRNGTGGMDATLTNNNVNTDAQPANFPLSGILVQSNCATTCNTLRSDIANNTVAVPSGGCAFDLTGTCLALVRSGATSTCQLVDRPPTPGASASAELVANNPFSASTSASATCTLIPGPIVTPP